MRAKGRGRGTSAGGCDWRDLPPELWSRIAAHVEMPTQARLGEVCRGLDAARRQAITAGDRLQLQRALDRGRPLFIPCDPLRQAAHARVRRLLGEGRSRLVATTLQTLRLELHSLTDDALPHLAAVLARHTRQLETLSLRGNGLVVPPLQWLAVLPRLRELHLGGQNAPNGGLCALEGIGDLSSLTSLDIGDLPDFAGIDALGDGDARWGFRHRLTWSELAEVAGLRALRRLDVSGARAVIDEPGRAALAGMTRLTALAANSVGLSNAGAERLTDMVRLEVLEVAMNNIGAAGAAALAGLPRLARLRISDNPLGDAGLAAVFGMRHLVDLDISWVLLAAGQLRQALPGGLTSVTLGPLADTSPAIGGLGSCRRLRRLRLVGLRAGGAAVRPLGGQLARLEALTFLALRRCDLDNARLAELGSLTALRHLDLSGNAATGPGMVALGRMRELTALVLADNPVGPRALGALARLPSLAALSLARCRFSSRQLAGLRRLSALRHLDLSGLDLTDAAMPTLSALGHLRELRLAGNEVLWSQTRHPPARLAHALCGPYEELATPTPAWQAPV